MAHAETDCRTVLERLYQYLDGEVAGVECDVIQIHLEACGSCMRHYGFERDFKLMVYRKCHEGRVPEGLAERIRSHIRAALGD